MVTASRRSKHWLLTLWLIGPLATVVLLVLVIAYRDPNTIGLVAPPVGAGAGNTGGANAIGEMLAGHNATHNAQAASAKVDGTQNAPTNSAQSAQPETTPAAAKATLVQPESLPQGFILVVDDGAKRATQTSPIFIASNLYSNWNPGAKDAMLTAQSDMKWRIELAQPAQWKDGKTGARLEFKFTRGSWDLEELTEAGTKVGNRTLAPIDASALKPGEKPIIELRVAKWGDMASGYVAAAGDAPYVPIKVTGEVRRVQIAGGAGGAENQSRDCLVWLPDGYDKPENAARKYPVLYMFDGQNLFAKHTGIAAEWGMDETASTLIAGGKVEPFIIVGIPHGGTARISEYLPVDAIPGAAKPAGRAFAEFLVTQIKPRIERTFRVETDRAKVGVGGSSLGGAMAMLCGVEYPEQFGLVLAESLPLRTGNHAAWSGWLEQSLTKKDAGKLPTKVFLGFGSVEYGNDESVKATNTAYAKDIRDLALRLTGAGMPAGSVKVVETENGGHTESVWAERLKESLPFLLGR